MTFARGVVAAGFLAILVISGFVLSESAQRLSGSNLTPNGAFVEGLSEGQEICQSAELLPADTAALKMTIGTYGRPGPPLGVTFTGVHGERLTAGILKGGWKEGPIEIPVTHVSRTTAEARFCLRNRGPQPIAVAGDAPDPGYQLQVAGRTIESQRLSIEYLRPGRESWLQLLPTIVHRFSLAKAGFVRGWAWLGVLVLMLTAVALAIGVVLKEDA